jgi:hypothetical protein
VRQCSSADGVGQADGGGQGWGGEVARTKNLVVGSGGLRDHNENVTQVTNVVVAQGLFNY